MDMEIIIQIEIDIVTREITRGQGAKEPLGEKEDSLARCFQNRLRS